MTSLADLDAMDGAGLAPLWSDLLGREVPPNMALQFNEPHALNSAHKHAATLNRNMRVLGLMQDQGRRNDPQHRIADVD